jgi:hypothetical protein
MLKTIEGNRNGLKPWARKQYAQYSLLRIQEILENNFTLADGYTVNVNYTNGTKTKARTGGGEDTRLEAKTLLIQIRNQKSGSS